TAKRAIQARIDASIEASKKRDLETRLAVLTPDWTGKLKDGDSVTRRDLEESFRQQHRTIISVSNETRINVDDIELHGNEAIVHTSQRFVRTVPGNGGKPEVVRSSVTHREGWVKTERGWLNKYIEELEQGPTIVNGVEVAQDRAGWKFVRIVWEEGVARARAAFEEARRRDSQATLFQEATLNNLGYRLIQKGRVPDALEVFRLNTEAYPQSANVWDSLAEAYMNNGDRDLAIQNYRKSLELNPKNTNAVPMLEKLGAPLPAEAIWKMMGAPPDVELMADVAYGEVAYGRALRMHILRPRTPSKEPLPVIVFIHGGGWFEGHHNRGLGPLLHFAERGYLCATVEYRLSDEAKFPAQIEDIKAAIRYLRAKAKELHLDPKRIGVWGQSAGGHLASLLGTSGGVKELEGSKGRQKFSSRVEAVVDWNGPVDFLEPKELERLMAQKQAEGWKTIAMERLFGGPVLENKGKAVRANPVTYVTRDDPPFLIMHGDEDQTVALSQSRLLYAALKTAGVDATLTVIKGAGHFGVDGVSPLQSDFAAMMDAFFDKHLKRNK
ncbi:MAG TPA: alpha/beta fold hydrolase, partial [Pyrinomonadaceae bacterium]|nr:alpha/beta fold hydrolase [Pyrinomonadaceae bacterium]